MAYETKRQVSRHDRRYERIAAALIDQITNGVFAPGDRLPSVRKIMVQENVSLTTAAHALDIVSDSGLAEARPRSGLYVRADATPAPRDEALRATQTARRGRKVTIHHLIEEIFQESAQPKLLPLGTAEIDKALQPYADLNRALAFLARDLGSAATDYCLPPGHLPLRRQIARLMNTRGITTTHEDVVVTAGTSEAMEIALRAVAKPGDRIAVESPTYFGILQWIEVLGLKAIEIATHPRDGLDLTSLEKVLRRQSVAAIAINPTFHNPFGSAMSQDRALHLLRIAETHGVPIIEDDVYSDLYFGAQRQKPVKAFDKTGQVIYCSSLSKTLAPGLRIGWYLAANPREALANVQLTRNFGVSALPQIILAEYLKSGRYARHVKDLRQLFVRQNLLIRAAILEHFPQGTRVSAPLGGYVYWIDVPHPFNALSFRKRALAAGISIAPGPLFSASGRFLTAFRLCLGHKWTPRLERAVALLGQLARSA